VGGTEEKGKAPLLVGAKLPAPVALSRMANKVVLFEKRNTGSAHYSCLRDSDEMVFTDQTLMNKDV
jgi:hypothetical protein